MGRAPAKANWLTASSETVYWYFALFNAAEIDMQAPNVHGRCTESRSSRR